VLLWDENVVLNKCIDCFVLVTHFDLNWVVKRGTLELLYFRGHGGREKVSIPVLGDLGQNEGDLLLKVHGEEAISFVEDEELELLQVEALGVGQMVSHSAWSADDYVRVLAQGNGLGDHIKTSD